MQKRTKIKRGRTAKLADDVRLFLKATPNASALDISKQLSVSYSYANKLVRRYASVDDAPNDVWCEAFERRKAQRSDGSTARYYELPVEASELQDLISHKNMNAQIGEIFRSCYRFGEASHSDQLRDAKKIKFYIDAEVQRLSSC